MTGGRRGRRFAVASVAERKARRVRVDLVAAAAAGAAGARAASAGLVAAAAAAELAAAAAGVALAPRTPCTAGGVARRAYRATADQEKHRQERPHRLTVEASQNICLAISVTPGSRAAEIAGLRVQARGTICEGVGPEVGVVVLRRAAGRAAAAKACGNAPARVSAAEDAAPDLSTARRSLPADARLRASSADRVANVDAHPVTAPRRWFGRTPARSSERTPTAEVLSGGTARSLAGRKLPRFRPRRVPGRVDLSRGNEPLSRAGCFRASSATTIGPRCNANTEATT